MSRETRTPLIRVIVIIAITFLTTGLVGHLIHKLDFPSALLLMFGFAAFSGGITWLTIWDDRRTREHLVCIAAQLAPYDLDINVCKGGVYEVVSQGELVEELVTDEPLDLDELEAWISGLHYGVSLARTWQDDGAIPAGVPETEG